MMRLSAIGLWLWMAPLGAGAPAGLMISEFLASNDEGLLDEDGDHSDWVEVQNVGQDTVSLAGWFLTDIRRSPSDPAGPLGRRRRR